MHFYCLTNVCIPGRGANVQVDRVWGSIYCIIYQHNLDATQLAVRIDDILKRLPLTLKVYCCSNRVSEAVFLYHVYKFEKHIVSIHQEDWRVLVSLAKKKKKDCNSMRL